MWICAEETKDEVIVLALEYQNKFDSTLTNINKGISDLSKVMRKCSQNFASPDKSTQNWGSRLFGWNDSATVTVSTQDGNV